MKPSRKQPAAPRRRHRFINKQTASGETINMTPSVRATVAGRAGAPQPSNHIPISYTTGVCRTPPEINQTADRMLDDILLAAVVLNALLIGGICFYYTVIVPGLLFILFAGLIIFASTYARRPRSTHRFARTLRAVFYKSFTYPGDRHPPRLRLRMTIVILISILLGVFGANRFNNHSLPANPGAVEAPATP